MKIAVLFSGLIPDKVPVEENVKSVYAAFPTADFYFGSWDIPENVDKAFLDVKFKPMKHHYNCFNANVKYSIQNIRECRKKQETINDYDISVIKTRHSKRNNINQILIHTKMYEKYVEKSNYDIVIRARYETYIDPVAVSKFDYFINLCQQHNKPIGFETVDDDYKLMPLGWNTFAQSNPKNTRSFSDWLIIHKKEYFKPEIIWKLYKDKKIRYAESGWYDVLFMPNDFDLENTCWNGYVTLRRE